MGVKVQLSAENRTEFIRDLTIHEGSFFPASMVRQAQRIPETRKAIWLASLDIKRHHPSVRPRRGNQRDQTERKVGASWSAG